MTETGFNRGPKIKVYLASSGNVEGQPWCGAFVCWCLKVLGLKVPAGAGAAANWFPPERVIYRRGGAMKRKPKTGDCVGFIYGSRIGHVGFVDRWTDDFAITVEGNTGSGHGITREGDGVHKMRRLASQISLVSCWIPR
ncbi:CHAP domain-containing protein [Hymenobacter sp. BT664]|uniref:CHAP domain-containing protein n=1 Tax=Hymenobacter montanus TaxID=2771359 RepID=A0A927BGX8_9BACT|nr:CHAP domain-containing protein [Hymenobacter montanus]MBD2769708.1 CHAP domain-containing protein [Hymenobacter montanus]